MVSAGAIAEKAGFWTRFVAILVDAILISVVSQIVSGIAGGADVQRGSGISTLIGIVYYVYFWSSYGNGQTLGMRAFNIKVVRTDGSQLDVGGAIIRYIGFLISIIPLFLGLIWAAFDAEKQGWHDKLAKTYVVRA